MRGALSTAWPCCCGARVVATPSRIVRPQRIVSFGDEATINTDGSKYTVNGLRYDTATPPVGTPDCTVNTVWVQQLAYAYGLAFTEGRCPGLVTTPNGQMEAVNGARAADLTTQINNFLASDSFSRTDLVTVMVGTHDIIAEGDVVAAGTAVADAVIRITDLGAKVIVSTVPSVGLTPYAIGQGPAAVLRLNELSTAFNTALRLRLQNVRDGGRAAGLVLADEIVLAMVNNPDIYGLRNVVAPVCTVALPGCSMTTLDPTAVAASRGNDWLWADDRRLGANAQGRLGSSAVNRAQNNPF